MTPKERDCNQFWNDHAIHWPLTGEMNLRTHYHTHCLSLSFTQSFSPSHCLVAGRSIMHECVMCAHVAPAMKRLHIDVCFRLLLPLSLTPGRHHELKPHTDIYVIQVHGCISFLFLFLRFDCHLRFQRSHRMIRNVRSRKLSVYLSLAPCNTHHMCQVNLVCVDVRICQWWQHNRALSIRWKVNILTINRVPNRWKMHRLQALTSPKCHSQQCTCNIISA